MGRPFRMRRLHVVPLIKTALRLLALVAAMVD